MTIDVKTLARSLVDAAHGLAGESWSDVRAIAEMELHKLAQSAADIERLVRARHIDDKHARMLFEIYRTAANTALLSVESVTAALVEEVMNAAIGVIGKAITRSLGIALF